MNAIVQISSEAAVARGAAEDTTIGAGMQARWHALSAVLVALACTDLHMTRSFQNMKSEFTATRTPVYVCTTFPYKAFLFSSCGSCTQLVALSKLCQWTAKVVGVGHKGLQAFNERSYLVVCRQCQLADVSGPLLPCTGHLTGAILAAGVAAAAAGHPLLGMVAAAVSGADATAADAPV